VPGSGHLATVQGGEEGLPLCGGEGQRAVLAVARVADEDLAHVGTALDAVGLPRGRAGLRPTPAKRPIGQWRPGAPASLITASLEESGHGLPLVEALTTHWWTRGDSRSRTVCAEILLRASG
jgi:hypothetical protein